MINLEQPDVYMEYSSLFKRLGFDYDVIEGSDYNSYKDHMKFMNLLETANDAYNWQHAGISYRYRIRRSTGAAIDATDIISLRQNLWSHFNKMEHVAENFQIYNISNNAHYGEQVMSLLRFPPVCMDPSLRSIFYGPDMLEKYYTVFTRHINIDEIDGIDVSLVPVETIATGTTAAIINIHPDEIQNGALNGHYIILKEARRGGVAAAADQINDALRQVTHRFVQIVTYASATRRITCAAGTFPATHNTEDDPATANLISGKIVTTLQMQNYISKNMNGTMRIWNQLIPSIVADNATSLSNRVFLPLRLLSSTNYYTIDQVMKNMKNSLRFDLCNSDQIVVKSGDNTTQGRSYIVTVTQPELILPILKQSNIHVKNTFYNLKGTREQRIFYPETNTQNITAGALRNVHVGEFSSVDEAPLYMIIYTRAAAFDGNPMTFQLNGLQNLVIKIGSEHVPLFRPDLRVGEYLQTLYWAFCQCRDKLFRPAGVPVDYYEKFISIDFESWKNFYPLICVDLKRHMQEIKSLGETISISYQIHMGTTCDVTHTVVRDKGLLHQFNEVAKTVVKLLD